MSDGTPCEDRERWKLRVVFCEHFFCPLWFHTSRYIQISHKPSICVSTIQMYKHNQINVVIGDDPGSVKSDDLRAAFEAKGATVADAFVPEGKAFGFVSFSSQEEAEKYGKSGLFPL